MRQGYVLNVFILNEHFVVSIVIRSDINSALFKSPLQMRSVNVRCVLCLILIRCV